MSGTRRTQVGIVGAGPSGLMLGHLLSQAGIDNLVLESRSRNYVENRHRAGVLEHEVAALLRTAGLGARMDSEGQRHEGFRLLLGQMPHRIDLQALTGKHVTIWGQNDLVRDLVAARLAAGAPTLFNVAHVELGEVDGAAARIRYRQDGTEREIDCDFIAGCDGFRGICRPSLPEAALQVYDQTYPFAWLGILANAPPACAELVFASQEEGFALASLRSATLSRHFLQCAADEDINTWSDARIWDALHRRLDCPGVRVNEGPILQRGLTPLRSFVVAPMQYGRLFLVGDAAHVAPPTGAKGMNTAIHDVWLLARAMENFYRGGETRLLDGFSNAALRHVWLVQRFSWWMTRLLHRLPESGSFARQMQLAELDYVTSSVAGATTLAENFVGLPLAPG